MEQPPTLERPQQHRVAEAEGKGLLYRCPTLCVCTLSFRCRYTGHMTFPSVCDLGSSEPHNCVHNYPLVELCVSLSISENLSLSLSLSLKMCVSLFASLSLHLFSHSLCVPPSLVVCLSFLVCVFSPPLFPSLLLGPTLIMCYRKAMWRFSEYLLQMVPHSIFHTAVLALFCGVWYWSEGLFGPGFRDFLAVVSIQATPLSRRCFCSYG